MEALMLLLQAGCCVESLCKGLHWKALYWGAAFLLTLAVIKGIKT